MKLKSIIFSSLLALTTLSTPTMAQQAQTPVDPKCPYMDFSKSGFNNWFLGIHPSDDLISVWCRLQQLPGNVRFNILFPTYNVHHSWDTSFQGANLTPAHIVRLVQSLLPMENAPAANAEGMEFHKVLQSVVQLQAQKSPSGRELGFAPAHPASKELVLWEPIVLRIKPVVLAGQEFTMSITLKPNLGILALALQGKATDLKLKGWKGRMDIGGMFGRGCSDLFPACENIPDLVTYHAPWIVTDVELTAQGDNITSAAAIIMDRLSQSHRSANGSTNIKSLDPKSGAGTLIVDDKQSKLEMKADGSPSGTKAISIKWTISNNNDTYWAKLQDVGNTYKVGEVEKDTRPTAPDVLDKL